MANVHIVNDTSMVIMVLLSIIDLKVDICSHVMTCCISQAIIGLLTIGTIYYTVVTDATLLINGISSHL